MIQKKDKTHQAEHRQHIKEHHVSQYIDIGMANCRLLQSRRSTNTIVMKKSRKSAPKVYNDYCSSV